MATVMKQKKYGYVKPVKKAKTVPKYTKPSTGDLRSLYISLKKTPDWKVLDVLGSAMQWYDKMDRYRADLPKTGIGSTAVARLTLQAVDWRKKGFNTTITAEKVRCFIRFIECKQKILLLESGKVPKIGDYLKKSNVFVAKMNTVIFKLEQRFSPILNLLAMAIPKTEMDFGVVPDMYDSATGEYISRRYDHALNKMMFSRSHLIQIKKKIRIDGLLPVIIKEIMWLSRAQSCKNQAKENGRFLPDAKEWVLRAFEMLDSFVDFAATHPEAPVVLVRRKAPRKKREHKSSGIKNKKITQADQLLDMMQAELTEDDLKSDIRRRVD